MIIKQSETANTCMCYSAEKFDEKQCVEAFLTYLRQDNHISRKTIDQIAKISVDSFKFENYYAMHIGIAGRADYIMPLSKNKFGCEVHNEKKELKMVFPIISPLLCLFDVLNTDESSVEINDLSELKYPIFKDENFWFGEKLSKEQDWSTEMLASLVTDKFNSEQEEIVKSKLYKAERYRISEPENIEFIRDALYAYFTPLSVVRFSLKNKKYIFFINRYNGVCYWTGYPASDDLQKSAKSFAVTSLLFKISDIIVMLFAICLLVHCYIGNVWDGVILTLLYFPLQVLILIKMIKSDMFNIKSQYFILKFLEEKHKPVFSLIFNNVFFLALNVLFDYVLYMLPIWLK